MANEIPRQDSDEATRLTVAASTTIARGDLVGLNSSGQAVLADANAVPAVPAIGFALGGGTAGQVIGVCPSGEVSNSASSWTPGSPVWLSDTAGGYTQTQPNSSLTQKIGYALSATKILVAISAHVHDHDMAYSAVLAAGVTAAIGDLLSINSSGEFIKADADTGPVSAVFVALQAGAPAATIRAAQRAIVSLATWSWTPGDRLYLSATTGGLTATRPSTATHLVQPVGLALTATKVAFNIVPFPLVVQAAGNSTVAFG